MINPNSKPTLSNNNIHIPSYQGGAQNIPYWCTIYGLNILQENFMENKDCSETWSSSQYQEIKRELEEMKKEIAEMKIALVNS